MADHPLIASGWPVGARIVSVPVKTLVIGTGGREHALALALARDPEPAEVHVAPGNPGIGQVATLHDVDPMDGEAVADLAEQVEAAEAAILAAVASGSSLSQARREHGYHGLQTRDGAAVRA